MQPDLDYLRKHYASIDDEALLEIDPEELVEGARKVYDEELAKRGLTLEEADGDEALPAGFAERPEWSDESAQVYAWDFYPGQTPAQEAEDACRALEAAGIPCYIDSVELPQEPPTSRRYPSRRWLLMVPGKLNMHATSVVEQAIDNPVFEGTWRTHMEMLSDEELLAMHPDQVFCGLYDKLERIERAYKEELERRGIEEEEEGR